MSIDINKIVLENYEFAPNTVRITKEDSYLFTIPHSREYKRTKKDCDIIGKQIVARFNNHDKLIEALKKVNDEYNYALKLLAEAGGFAYSENSFSIETKQLLQLIEKETL